MFDSKMINYWSSVCDSGCVYKLINPMKPPNCQQLIKILSWDRLSLGASDLPVLIPLAEIGLIDQITDANKTEI